MKKGIIYIMNTAVSGLVKIGKTGTKNFNDRMRFLEGNGYYNVVGLRKFFAIELEDYDDKERLLHEIFAKHKVGESELFALDNELVKQLLLAFEGTVVYPKIDNKEEEFDKVTETRKQGSLFTFYKKGIKDGEQITFVDDDSIQATVVGEREVEYNNQTWKLSPLTYKIYEDMGQLNTSGAYQGANYFLYKGTRLKDLPDII